PHKPTTNNRKRQEMVTRKRKSGDQLLAVQPNGEYQVVPCTYEGIKEGLSDATFDFVHNEAIGMYVDDEGMINELEFNVPASLVMGRALFGPVVLCAAYPDDEGDTLPANEVDVEGLKAVSRIWQEVLADASRLGQVVMTHANETTIPPPRIFSVNDVEFEQFLATGQLPDREPDA